MASARTDGEPPAPLVVGYAFMSKKADTFRATLSSAARSEESVNDAAAAKSAIASSSSRSTPPRRMRDRDEVWMPSIVCALGKARGEEVGPDDSRSRDPGSADPPITDARAPRARGASHPAGGRVGGAVEAGELGVHAVELRRGGVELGPVGGTG